MANNHALDRGAVGLENTIKNVDASGLVGFGARLVTHAVATSTVAALAASTSTTSTSTSAILNYKITEKNGIRIGFLSYTYGTNGLSLPKSKSGMLSYINKGQISKDIKDLKKQNVDAVVVAIHFGVEYKLDENANQRDLAQFTCDSGADIVLGDHPHVLEPITYLNDKKCLVIYSLGNFISAMPNLYMDLGGILKVEITKNEGGDIGIGNASSSTSSISMKPDFIATWVKRGTGFDGRRYYTVLPLDADNIGGDIKITASEAKRIELYKDYVNTKIKVGIVDFK